jgi:hypothetical protein
MSVYKIGLIFLLITILSGCVDIGNQYSLHKDIIATIFWIGEEGTDENGYIPNNQSAWDGSWKDHYGGIDDPYNRNGFYPKNNGNKKSRKNESIYKNRWIKIIKGNKIAYAQWEDVGPFEEDDVDYVFGESKPKNTINDAGLDVSPAVRDYLGLEDVDIVDWQFVDFKDVPNGSWTEIITRSQISW